MAHPTRGLRELCFRDRVLIRARVDVRVQRVFRGGKYHWLGECDAFGRDGCAAMTSSRDQSCVSCKLRETIRFYFAVAVSVLMGVSNRGPVSVILPTLEWGTACEQLVAQLEPDDELLVVCDTDADPVANHDAPDGVEILMAGEPDGCAAKANAIAYGMEQATNDRFVWSDDDYERDPEWLDRLVRVGEAHGPAAVEPLIVSDGPYLKLLEPVSALVIAVYDIYRDGGEGGYPWGGGVTFTRGELQEPTEHLCAELRRSISDDNVLNNYLEDTYTPRDWRIRIPVSGGFDETISRLTRWMRADHVRYDLTPNFLIATLIAVVCLVFPTVVAPLITAVTARSYKKLGYQRWTFVLAYFGLLMLPLMIGLGLFRSEFTWGKRQYRLHDLYDIEVSRVESE